MPDDTQESLDLGAEGAGDTATLDDTNAAEGETRANNVDNSAGDDRSNAADETTAPAKGSAPAKAAADPNAKPGRSAPASQAIPPKGANGQPPKPGASAATTPKPTTQLVDPHKQWNDDKAQWGRERAEMARQLQTFQKGEQERKEAAERQNLKRYHPDHPDHQGFRSLKARRDALPEQLRAIDSVGGLDPEQREKAKEALINASFKPEELDELRDHQQMNQEFLLNPIVSSRNEARNVAREEIQDAFRQFSAHQRASADVQRDTADAAKIAPHTDFMRERLQAGDSYASVMERVEYRNRISELEAQVNKASSHEATVDRQAKANAERARLAKGNAATTRDSKVSGQPDFYAETTKWAAEQNIKPGTPRFNKHLRSLEESHASSRE